MQSVSSTREFQLSVSTSNPPQPRTAQSRAPLTENNIYRQITPSSPYPQTWKPDSRIKTDHPSFRTTRPVHPQNLPGPSSFHYSDESSPPTTKATDTFPTRHTAPVPPQQRRNDQPSPSPVRVPSQQRSTRSSTDRPPPAGPDPQLLLLRRKLAKQGQTGPAPEPHPPRPFFPQQHPPRSQLQLRKDAFPRTDPTVTKPSIEPPPQPSPLLSSDEDADPEDADDDAESSSCYSSDSSSHDHPKNTSAGQSQSKNDNESNPTAAPDLRREEAAHQHQQKDAFLSRPIIKSVDPVELVDHNSSSSSELHDSTAKPSTPIKSSEQRHPAPVLPQEPSSGLRNRIGNLFRDKTGRFASTTTNPVSEDTKRGFFRIKGHGRATSVNLEDLSADDMIIAVMGPTGSGKSSFIQMATGDYQGVGHDLESCTTEIAIVKFHCLDRSDLDVLFVDTPGFDDTNKSDTEILNMIADWLTKTYSRDIKLAGILYFHRISDNRMAGSPLKNLQMFEKLCGKNALKNIILTTTMWDEVEQGIGTQREKELKGRYWKTMIDQGSKAVRYLNTPESAWDILDPFLQTANARHAVLLQQEMVDMKKQLRETKAGQALFSTLENLVKKQQEMLLRIRAETKYHDKEGGADDGAAAVLDALREEYEDLRKKLAVTVAEMQTLKVPVGKRLLLRIFRRSLDGNSHTNSTNDGDGDGSSSSRGRMRMLFSRGTGRGK